MAYGDGAVGTDQSQKNVFADSSHDCREKLSLAGQSDTCKQATAKTPDSSSVHLPGFELAADATAGTTQKATIDVDGQKRDVWLHLPANYDASKPMPLMLVFNGVGPGGSGMENFTGLSKKADEKGFAVAYLDGTGIQHSYNNHEWPFDNGADDVKYTSQVIDTLEKDLNIDKNKVGLVGFSEGGSFAHLAASQLSDKISSVSEVEGWMSGKESKTSSPVSELSIHGKDDRIVPFDGTKGMAERTALKILGYATLGPLGPLTDVVSGVSNLIHGDSPFSFTPLEAAAVALQEFHNVYIEPQSHTVDQYKKDDNISGKPTVDKHGNITKTTYRNGQTGAEVEQIAIDHGEHAWPGSPDHSGDIPLIGMPSNDINSTNEVTDFFLNHPKTNK